nr:sugar-binding domain-containing protein [Luteipulveratus mongoliensis]
MSDLPRPEYPRPSVRRNAWLNLNGQWQFEVDPTDSGLERGLLQGDLVDEITVPFAPESELSGLGRTAEFLEAVWYRRALNIPAEWASSTILLHFGAADYDTTVWVDGVERGRHRGGFTSFTVDLGPGGQLRDGAILVVRCRDTHHGPQPRGKQTRDLEGSAAVYGRTTGIWQTVWLEPVPPTYLERPRVTPDVANGMFHLEVPVRGPRRGLQLRTVLSDDAGEVVATEVPADLDLTARAVLVVPSERRRLWSLDDPFLYDLSLTLVDESGQVVDQIESYAGLRSVAIDGKAVLLNGKPVFQRLVLDQGYYPDGLMTAPSDQALIDDIEMSMAAGFNGARLHQKVFEERFLHHADRLGYLVWGEFGDWGCREPMLDVNDHQRPGSSYITEWLEAVERDYSHPSIVGWCPLNETFQVKHDRTTVLDDVTLGMFLATKAFDTSRPVLDTSGYSHRVEQTDIYDSHLYEQDPAKFAEMMAPLADGRPFTNAGPDDEPWSTTYREQPYFCSEFGGIWWSTAAAQGRESWGYGEAVTSEEAVYERFQGLVDALLDNPLMFGYCYTQLTDVFQEQNGVYLFDRGTKLDVKRLRAIQERRAAIES